MPLILDVITKLDERSAAAEARRLEHQFTAAGETAGVGFAAEMIGGISAGFRGADFDSMLGVLGSTNLAAQALTHGKAIGLAFAGGITAAAAGAIADLGIHIGETFEKINRDITTHTSASGKALAGMKADADALVASLDTSTQHLGADYATLASRLQMGPGEAIKELTKNVEVLRDRFGDFNVDALSGAFLNMGVTGKNANEVLASIGQTVQTTQLPLSDLATQLAQNTELFKDLHLSTEQSAAMLGELHTQGLPASTALMGVQMAMKAAAKEGEDLNTFIQRTSASLAQMQAAGDEAGMEKLTLSLGGPRKFVDVQRAVEDLNAARQQNFAGDENYFKNMEKDTETLENLWHRLKNTLDTALAPGGKTMVDYVSEKMDGLIAFINAHADDLRKLFEGSIDAIISVVEAIGHLAALLGEHPALINAVLVAFGTWESIRGVNAVLTAGEGILAWLRAVPEEAAAAGAGIEAGMAAGEVAAGGLAETLGIIAARLIFIGTGVAMVGGLTGADAPGAKATDQNVTQGKALEDYSKAHGGTTGHEVWPKGTNEWLQGKGPMPGELAPYMHPGAGTPGGRAGTAPAPPGSPLAPSDATRAGPGLPGAPVAPGGAGDLSSAATPFSPGELAKIEGDTGGGGHKLPQAPQVPYPAGYGAPPRPGENIETYRAEQEILEKRHAIDEAQARLNQLEATGNANADDIQKAKNDVLKAQEESQAAELGIYDKQLKGLNRHAADLEQLGAKIDNDFGISKGLPGIAENLTKFLANLAFAPAFGAMEGARSALGYPGGQGAGKGMVGMIAGAAGMYPGGPLEQFMPGYGGRSGGGSPFTGLGGGGWPGWLGGRSGLGSGAGAAGGGFGGGAGLPTDDETLRTAAAGVLYNTGNVPLEAMPSYAAGAIKEMFPQIGRIGGTRPSGPGTAPGTHDIGRTLDVMMPGGSSPDASTPGDLEIGNQIYAWLNQHAAQLGISSMIWQGVGHNILGGRSGAPGSGWQQGGHHDHIDVQFMPPGYHPPGSGPQPATQDGSYAAGGPTPGGGGDGGIPIVAHPGEHVLTADDVNAMGGQQAVYNFRAGLQGTGGPGSPMPDAKPGGAAGGAGATRIGGMSAPKGLGSGFTVTGGGLIGVAESIPSTVANMAIEAGAAAAAALHGGAIEDLLPSYGDGGAIGDEPGGGGAAGAPGPGAGTAAATAGPSPAGGGGTGAGGGGAPGGSVLSAAIGIGIQEANEAISKGGQAAGAIVGGLQQTFGLQQFAGSQLAQQGWITRIIGGITGAQPQLPNAAGTSGNMSPQGVAGMSPMGGGPGGSAAGMPGMQGPLVHIENLQAPSPEAAGKAVGDHVGATYGAAQDAAGGHR